MVQRLAQPGTSRDAHAWVERAVELLDERHLVTWSRNAGHRERFALEMARHVQSTPDVQAVVIAGAVATSLDAFCRQIERALPGAGAGGGTGARLRRTVHGEGGVVARLRDGSANPLVHTKRRYYLWRDADAMLRVNPGLFAELADAMMGVAAEAEFASEDLLLLHRVVFIGGAALEAYGRDDRGQFRSWRGEPGRGEPGRGGLRRGAGSAGAPLWAVVTGVERPPLAMYQIA